MNCCDDNGKCRCDLGGQVKPGQRSCDELGLCQERFPACGGCSTSHNTERMTAAYASGPQPRYDLAPGVIEGYRPGFLGTPAQRRELKRLGLSTLWWAGWSSLAGVAVGLISGYFTGVLQ